MVCRIAERRGPANGEGVELTSSRGTRGGVPAKRGRGCVSRLKPHPAEPLLRPFGAPLRRVPRRGGYLTSSRGIRRCLHEHRGFSATPLNSLAAKRWGSTRGTRGRECVSKLKSNPAAPPLRPFGAPPHRCAARRLDNGDTPLNSPAAKRWGSTRGTRGRGCVSEVKPHPAEPSHHQPAHQ